MRLVFRLLLLLLSTTVVSSKVLDFLEDFGGIPFDNEEKTCRFNSDLLSRVLQHNASNNTLLFPANYTFHFVHGIYAKHVNNTKLQLDGTLRFERADLDIDSNHHPFPSCLTIDKSDNVTITSSSRGLIDGRGPQWWGIPLIGYLQIMENRPRLVRFNQTSNLLIENVILKDSPYHTLYLETVNNVEIRKISIVARRTTEDSHDWIDLSAFNTDGIDVSGHNVWVHDVDIWVQDDCIAVKDSLYENYTSTNMTFERVNASGLGFVIGSIGGSTVNNITFRNSYLHRPVKGIYLKLAKPGSFWEEKNLTGLVQNIQYQNITMEAPTQWPIWIGPAQQADNRDPCFPNPCSLCWPMLPIAKCHVVNKSKYKNITLQNVRINNPKMSPGVLLGNGDNTIENVVFDSVRVTKGAPVPMARYKLSETFPGLLQPIHDPYVPNMVEEVESDWIARLSNLFLTLLSPISSLFIQVASPVSWSPFPKPKWKRTNRYFACEGIVRGIAKGNAWPVPRCFEREKPSSRSLRMWLFAAALVVCSTYFFTKRKRRSLEREGSPDHSDDVLVSRPDGCESITVALLGDE